jgi:RHS repeat-associated protein
VGLVEYAIDAAGRRLGKKVNGTLQKGWLYDGAAIVAELDGAGNVVSRFFPGGMIKGGVTYKIIRDHLGSPRLVVNASSGAIAQRMDFDEYGRVLQDTSPGFTPFGFAGGHYDPDTGLVRFGARDYMADVGRWTCKDPIRFDGGTNLYAYAVGDPINVLDRNGLLPVAESVAVVKAVAPEIAASGPGGWALVGAAVVSGAVGGTIGYLITPYLPIYAMPEPEFDYVSPLAGGSGGPPPTPTPRVGTGMGDSCPIDPKQLGHKWGQHKNDYPDWTHKDYMNRINDMYGNQSLPRYTYPNDAPLYRGETHIVQGKDLLRLDPNGGFRSLYPGASTTYPNGFPPK